MDAPASSPDSSRDLAVAVKAPADQRLAWRGKALAFRDGFEWVAACDLCGHKAFTTRASFPENMLFTGEEFRVVRCDGCALHFLDPRPSPELIGEYYPADYAAHDERVAPLAAWQRAVGGKDAPTPGWLRAFYLHLRQQIAWNPIPAFEQGGRFLDIGCGSGRLLDTMKALGWETFGIEVSPAAAERAIAKGHQVVQGFAESFVQPEGEFDAVYMWHVLEHTHRPSKALDNVKRYLKPGGRLILSVPNYKSFHAALYGRHWCAGEAPRHLYHFDKKTLHRYLSEAGFRDIEIATRSGATSWARGVRHAINGWFGTRITRDPAWALALTEVLVITSALVRFLGVGTDLRVTCRK